MLVLSRRVGEEVVIHGDIRVTIVAVQGDRVRIGIAAPKSVRIDRKEVHERRTEWFAGKKVPGPAVDSTPCRTTKDC